MRRAITALAGGATMPDAARRAGVGERTLYRWRAERPEFIAALRAADADQLQAAGRKLTSATDQALDVLIGVLNDPKAHVYARLRAADLVLQHRAKFAELGQLSERLAALEAATAHEGAK